MNKGNERKRLKKEKGGQMSKITCTGEKGKCNRIDYRESKQIENVSI